MRKCEETKHRDECLNEAYCEADFEAYVFAGPGCDEWVPKARARQAGRSSTKKSSSDDGDLAKRVRLLKKQTRG